MLHLKRITRHQVRVTSNDDYKYTTFEEVDSATIENNLEYKNLSEIKFNSYNDVLKYISDELITIAEEIEIDAYILTGDDDDTYDYTMYNGNIIKMSAYTLGYRVRVIKTSDDLTTQEVDD